MSSLWLRPARDSQRQDGRVHLVEIRPGPAISTGRAWAGARARLPEGRKEPRCLLNSLQPVRALVQRLETG